MIYLNWYDVVFVVIWFYFRFLMEFEWEYVCWVDLGGVKGFVDYWWFGVGELFVELWWCID